MIPGIDPKVDIAFKRVFGTQEWHHLTMALIDAVLQPAPWHRLAHLELLNPYTEQITLDDKLSILDIKARDDQGRLFNVEMQMASTALLPKRFLYYWAQLYGSQLTRGDDYGELCPTISICFVNGRVFSAPLTHHRRFRLADPASTLLLTDDLDIHLLELVNFDLQPADLSSPLDFWLYFLKNGVSLDADALSPPLDRPELQQAMEILKMFSQDEMARELYQGRIKAERDARMHELDAREAQEQAAAAQEQAAAAQEQAAAAQEQAAAAQEQAAAAQEQAAAAQEQAAAAQQRLAQSESRRIETEQEIRRELAKRIQLCERLLARPMTATTALLRHSTPALRELADALGQELLQV